jgi:hypothetical protein
VLDEFLFDEESSNSLRDFDDFRTSRGSLLESVGIEILEQWAFENPQVRIPRLASISLFKALGDSAEGWSPTFLRLLELVPDKRVFLENAPHGLRSTGWSGSLAEILSKRRMFLEQFEQHSDPHISALAIEKAQRLATESHYLRTREFGRMRVSSNRL